MYANDLSDTVSEWDWVSRSDSYIARITACFVALVSSLVAGSIFFHALACSEEACTRIDPACDVSISYLTTNMLIAQFIGHACCVAFTVERPLYLWCALVISSVVDMAVKNPCRDAISSTASFAFGTTVTLIALMFVGMEVGEYSWWIAGYKLIDTYKAAFSFGAMVVALHYSFFVYISFWVLVVIDPMVLLRLIRPEYFLGPTSVPLDLANKRGSCDAAEVLVGNEVVHVVPLLLNLCSFALLEKLKNGKLYTQVRGFSAIEKCIGIASCFTAVLLVAYYTVQYNLTSRDDTCGLQNIYSSKMKNPTLIAMALVGQLICVLVCGFVLILMFGERNFFTRFASFVRK